MNIQSPLTDSSVSLVKDIPTKKIITLYKKYSNVARFFTNLEKVSMYRCEETGYKFYYPFSVAGDGEFYEDLSKEPLYYIPWKDEHEVVNSYIKENDKVLEQGCANGDFLLKMHDLKGIEMYGTELNDSAKKQASEKGISFDSIRDADVTCSFQVLEHIADVKSFIHEAIESTKVSGKIIFAVPNNDCFLKDDKYGFLNMPPHHMGLWNKDVFSQLPNFFPLELVNIHEEKLQPVHYRAYYQIYFGDFFRPLGIVGKIINKVIFEVVGQYYISKRASKLKGHTIIAVYTKR